MSETGKTYYESARDEIIMRVRLRDQVILSHIVASGALFGIILSSLKNLDNAEVNNGITLVIALIIPFITLGTSVLVSTHSNVINNLGKFCIDELVPSIEHCRVNKYAEHYQKLNPWEASKTFSLTGKK